MRALLIASVCLLFLSLQGYAQRFEIGGWAGISNYYGDINTKLTFKMTRPAGGFFVRNNLGERFSFKHGASITLLEARDDNYSDPRKIQRNLSFRTTLLDLSTQLEFNFFEYNKLNPRKWYTPYITIGFSAFVFNPRANLNGVWFELQPIGTEGQNDPFYTGRERYRLVNFAIPIGGGMKFSVSKHWNIGFEIGFRRTFTDYLDDISTTYVSELSLPQGNAVAILLADRSAEVGQKSGVPGYQRGTSPKSDSYMFTAITFSYTFLSQYCPKP